VLTAYFLLVSFRQRYNKETKERVICPTKIIKTQAKSITKDFSCIAIGFSSTTKGLVCIAIGLGCSLQRGTSLLAEAPAHLLACVESFAEVFFLLLKKMVAAEIRLPIKIFTFAFVTL
jgi:hypothetical protein